MGKIYFSIIMPVYNVEKYLKYSLESVLKQTYGNYEIILINDGSTDSSGEICNEYAKKDKRIRVFHQENKGVSIIRYEALKKIRGEFTLFLDSDDYWEPNLLETTKKIIEDYNSDLVIFNYKNISENNEFLSDGKSCFNNGEIFESDKTKIYDKIFFTDEFNNLWTKGIKSSLIKLDNYSDYLEMRSGGDNMFLIPMLIEAKKIVNVDIKLYNYRYNSNGITSKFKISKVKDEFMRYNYTLKYLKKLNINNQNNLKKINDFFMKKILRLVLRIGYSNEKSMIKLDVLRNIRDSKELNKIFEKNNEKNLKNSTKYIYFMYKNRYYRILCIYAKLYNSFKILKKKIKYK